MIIFQKIEEQNISLTSLLFLSNIKSPLTIREKKISSFVYLWKVDCASFEKADIYKWQFKWVKNITVQAKSRTIRLFPRYQYKTSQWKDYPCEMIDMIKNALMPVKEKNNTLSVVYVNFNLANRS